MILDPWLDVAPCGFASFSDDGTLHMVNTTLAELLGYTRVELEGWHLQKILTPGARVFYQTHVFPLMKMKGRVDEIYLSLRTKDGRDLPVLMNGRRRNAVNDCAFMHTHQRDRFESELLHARLVAEQANAAKAKFLSMMSHDLRTPLTTIVGVTALFARDMLGPITEEQRENIGRIEEAAQLLTRVIGDILSFAQLESGSVEVRPVAVKVNDALARARAILGEHFTYTPCDEVVLADPDRLQQIVLNLLTNAIKYTRDGGQISVSCERAGDRVLIRVRDAGIGIPADQLERVFEPFVQLAPAVDSTTHGVGLGLAISRELARAMNGELTVESVVGEGSVFTVDLPRAIGQ